ncbi:MAG: lipid IV(A) 3-deoxy-D-manno-octulosonic acid transferase [Pseudomonadota bacterium]
MRRLYTALLYLLSPLLVLRLWLRGAKNPGYRQRIGERFGLISQQIPERCIWIHAVSVGESQATQPLVRWLKEQYPDTAIVISTTTPTGADRVRELYQQEVAHLYFPLDLPNAIERVLKRLQPRLLIIMETEIWPNLLNVCKRRALPVVLANARLSAKSAKGYARAAAMTREALRSFSAIAVQHAADAQRFIDLGAAEADVHLCGSIKFDVRIPASVREQGALLKAACGAERPVWIAASTHAGEEEMVLRVHRQLTELYADALLILTPRHPERFDSVAAMIEKSALTWSRRSDIRVCKPDISVFLGDTMGELTVFYAAADIAFVGGSLAPVGGHNILEPASLGLPVIVGPHMTNFLSITALLKSNGALQQVDDENALLQALEQIFDDADKRHAMGQAGIGVVEENQGALDCVSAVVSGLLHSKS